MMADVEDEGKRETQRGSRRTRWEEVPAGGAEAAAKGKGVGAGGAGAAGGTPAAGGGGGAAAGPSAATGAGTVTVLKGNSEGLAALKFNLQAAASAAREALEKAKKAALMQRAIQEQLRARQQQQQEQQLLQHAAVLELEAGRGESAGSSAIAAAGKGLTLRTLLARSEGASSLLLLGPAGAAAQLASSSSSGSAQQQQQQRLALTTAAAAAAVAQQQQDPQLQLLQLLRQQQQISGAAAAAAAGAAAAAAAGGKTEKQAAATAQERPRPLRFDRFGREIDEEGRVIPLTLVPHSSLKINQRTNSAVARLEATATKRGGSAGAAAAAEVEDMTQAEWYDPTINTRTAHTKRKRKALQFIEPGTYLRQEQQMHAYHRLLLKQQRREQQRREVSRGGEGAAAAGRRRRRGEAAGASEAAKTAAGETLRKREEEEEEALGAGKGEEEEESDEEALLAPEFLGKAWAGSVPSTEPWDLLFLNRYPADGTAPSKFESDCLVEHPVALKPAVDPHSNVIINMYLTVEERKKLRRRKRQEKEREKQDKIRMGLMPPPPPKVKLTNLMRVLGDKAVADPSKIEREVRQQMEKRLHDHEMRNAARKLPAELRRQKQMNKWQIKPGTGDVHVVVFSVDAAVSRRIIYKIDTNAQQLHLSGIAAVMLPPVKSVIVVEGSARAAKRFKALMLRRIKWDEAEGRPANDDEEDDAGSEKESQAAEGNSSCQLVWQGTTRSTSFSGWSVHRAVDAAEGKRLFKSSHQEHYWDIAQKYRDVRADYA